MLSIDNYHIELRKDKTVNTGHGIGGGLLVYVRNDVVVEAVDDGCDFNQYCSFKVYDKQKKRPLNFKLFYRSPNSSFENNVELLNVVKSCKKNSFLIGDANYPRLIEFNDAFLEDDIPTHPNCRSGRLFAATAHDLGMTQIVDFPTHIKGNVLDICYTDLPNNVISCENLGNLSNSDHAIIKLEIDFCPKFVKSSQKIRDWRRGDSEGLASHLADINFADHFAGKNVDEAWETFKSLTEAALDKFIPLVDRRKQGDPPWMTRHVKKLIRKKQRKWRQYANNRTAGNFTAFKEVEKVCKRTVQSAKRRFEKNLSVNKNKRPFNAYIKSRTKSRVNVGPLKIDGTVITDNKGMADGLNRFFASVFNSGGSDQRFDIPPKPCDTPLNNTIILPNNVKHKLDNLKVGSAPGPDGISSHFLRSFSSTLAPALSTLFNMSLQEEVVPSDWCLANVTPIFKKGGKGDPGNYRPVSLTSIPCKVMEACIRDELVDHLTRNMLINPSQHGFMKNKSVTTNLLEFLEVVTSDIDHGHALDIVYLDFAKAFDKVPHALLLDQLTAHRVGGQIHKWMKSWLLGRSQRVVLNGEVSDWAPVGSGVPQGSVLGPLCFLVYINDLDNNANLVRILKKFADDTKLGHLADSQQDIAALQASLDNLCDWADRWGMAFNVSKCKVMHLGRQNQKADYTMRGISLAKTSEERDIGVLVHDSLKPTRQCAEAARRARGVLMQISRAFHYRNRFTFVNLYKQYVRPHLEFSVPAWSPWTRGDIETLESVQKKAVGMVSGLQATSYKERLAELGLLSLETRRVQYDLTQAFKIIRGFDMVDRGAWFNLVGQNPGRLTRATSDPLNIVRRECRLDIRRHFFSNRVIEHWNALDHDTKRAKNVASFRNKISDYLAHLDARQQ